MPGELISEVDFLDKARTLEVIRTLIKSARIPQSFHFTYGEWRKNNDVIRAKIFSEFTTLPLAVRSSSNLEDGASQSKAGAFLTLLNVEERDLEKSIDRVFDSYEDLNETQIVLIQPMLQQVKLSGVAFSHDPNTCSPYRIVNWSENNDTSSVTSGKHPDRIWHQIKSYQGNRPERISNVISLLEELLIIFNDQPLDLEFAITNDGTRDTLWLLQVRPLVLTRPPESIEVQEARIQVIAQKVNRSQCSHPFLVGDTTVFGIMPDWNPAEILGIRPKPLALSLYRELITDSIWAYQRNNYGYRNLRSFPLMSHFFGLPYIDVRVSFNSFIPENLSEDLANKLVNHYIKRLIEEPTLHDKVEFEIVFSCYTLDFHHQKNRLIANGFSEDECDELEKSLRDLTNRILDPIAGIYRIDQNKIERLKLGREIVQNSQLDSLGKIYWFLEEAKRYGTLPFAGLARAGFIAIQLLKSLVNLGVISNEDYASFLSSFPTVSSELVRDRSILSLKDFLLKYGHLRPGTYDIMSASYDESPETYFSGDGIISSTPLEVFSLSRSQLEVIDKLLVEKGFRIDSKQLFEFIREGVQLREYAKFEFTKNLSRVLSEIKVVASDLNIPIEDIAYCNIAEFKELHITTSRSAEILLDSINRGKQSYDETLRVLLPPLITNPQDLKGFEWPTTIPNFITNERVTARVTDILDRDRLNNSIICIPNADPGFDWIFAYPIAGLITAWGGANSHMAIRANELRLPAIIGAGEILYRKWSTSNVIFIDCANRIVEVIS